MPVATDQLGNSRPISWAQLAPREHLVQIYPDDAVFLDCLEGFVAGGLRAGEGVVVIATPEHLAALRQRLRAAGVDPRSCEDQFITADAERTLQRFMLRGLPDESLFERVATELLARAAGPDGRRRVRAFGEMVVLLWNRGDTAATIRLEQLWDRTCHERGFSLLCAYPRSCFAGATDLSVRHVCATHAGVVHG